jgi:hypothetical protein
MKRIFAAFTLLILIASVLTGCSGEGMRTSWSHSNLSAIVEDGGWAISAGRVNGHATRDVDIDSESMYVFGTFSSGGVRVTISQGNKSEVITLTDNFAEYINMGEFSPGRVRLRIDFNEAHATHVILAWELE